MSRAETVMQIEAGALQRKATRVRMDYLGLAYNEHWGLLSSIFVVRGPVDDLKALLVWAEAR